MKKVVGIIGGMGPLATADFFLKLTRATPVKSERDHLHVIIESDPSIPDRTEAILSGDLKGLADALCQIARRLERMGAQLIAMPCNNAHVVLDQIRGAVSVPVVDMIEEVAKAVVNGHGHPEAVGLLATSGTVASGMYQRAFSRFGIEVLTPNEDEQSRLMQAIYSLKGEGLKGELCGFARRCAASLVERGAQVIVCGCTEIPLMLSNEDVSVPVVDCNEVLAKAVVRIAFGLHGGVNTLPASRKRQMDGGDSDEWQE